MASKYGEKAKSVAVRSVSEEHALGKEKSARLVETSRADESYFYLHADGILDQSDTKEEHEGCRDSPHQWVDLLRTSLRCADEDVRDEARSNAVGNREGEWHQDEGEKRWKCNTQSLQSILGRPAKPS